MAKMKKATAIKTYFSTESKPVEMSELKALIKADRKGYEEMAALCAIELGVEIE